MGECVMKHSTERILSTHGGSLPRPDDFDELIAAKAPVEELQKRLPSAVQEVVDEQIVSGLDVINDGEYVKAASGSYAAYILDRVTGWETDPDPDRAPKRAGTAERDRREFPGFYDSGLWFSGSGPLPRPGFFKPGAPRMRMTPRVCNAPVTYTGQAAIKADTDALDAALKGKKDVEGFIAALGPLSLGAGSTNLYYPSEEEYMMAVAEAVHQEYKAITDAGYIVQIDEPEFATTWSFYPDWSVEDLRKYLSFAVEVINHALEGLPEDQVRFHVCWGSGHRPHTTDVPLEAFADLLLKINAQAYSVESSNVRHAHEYTVWESVKVPDGKILVPGVISHATDLVEHPELVAERLINFANIVGKENVQASTDCGIGYRVGHAEIAWAKLRAMSEGCRIASEKLF
jgi:5-methyltetrahydropteroyltriglutamate--homocysteine methyltransferase